MREATGSGDCPVCGRRGLRLIRRAKADVRSIALRAHYPEKGKISREYCPGSHRPPERNH